MRLALDTDPPYRENWSDHSASFLIQEGRRMHQASASWSVEVVYRGIFQKRLSNRTPRGVVLAARREGKVGTAFARYGDSPERNGIPSKNFAVVATDEVELESSLARYEPERVEISIVVDDTMCK